MADPDLQIRRGGGWEGGFCHPDPEIRGGGYHKKIFFGPLPWIRHWVEFWLHVTVYTVYTWLKKRRLNFIAFHSLCSHGNPPHASRYEREEEFMINSFKKTNKRSCFFEPPTHSLGDRPLEQSLCRAPPLTGLPTRGPMEVWCWKVRVYASWKLVYLPFGTFFGASFWCQVISRLKQPRNGQDESNTPYSANCYRAHCLELLFSFYVYLPLFYFVGLLKGAIPVKRIIFRWFPPFLLNI